MGGCRRPRGWRLAPSKEKVVHLATQETSHPAAPAVNTANAVEAARRAQFLLC